jgi:hypothetical protein
MEFPMSSVAIDRADVISFAQHSTACCQQVVTFHQCSALSSISWRWPFSCKGKS